MRSKTMAFELSAPKRIGKIVIFGYCDIGAAGIRALHGLSAGKDTSSGREKEHAEGLQETGRESMTFSGMSNAVFSGCPAMEAVHFDYAADRNMGGDEGPPPLTLLKLNAEVGRDLSGSLAMAIVDLLAAQGAALEALIISAAVQPPKRHQTLRQTSSSMSSTDPKIPGDAVCTFSTLNRGETEKPSPMIFRIPAVSGLTELPSGARIADSFLTTLVALCRLEGLSLLVIARLGYRATGAAAGVDGTDEAIIGLGRCLGDVLGLKFNAQRACGASWSKGWKTVAQARSGVVPGYI